MRIRHTILTLLLLAPGVVQAQDTTAAPPEAPPMLCFRSKPAAECRAFLITEFSRNSEHYGDVSGSASRFQYEAGAMANVTARDAVGATVTFGGPNADNWGVNARYRRWLTPGIGLDVAPGIIVVGNDYSGRRVRLTTDVSLNLGGWLSGFARGESGADGGRTGVGMKLGELPGLLVGAGAYLLDMVVVPY